MSRNKTRTILTGLALIAGGIIWILNFTFGLVEPPFLQDFTPLTGNLDEGVAGAAILYGIQLVMGKRR